MNPFRAAIGIFLIILGVIGIFLPILQGVALIIVGVLVLKKKPIGVYLEKVPFFKRFRKK